MEIMKKHKHISDNELDKFLDRHKLDLEINMLSPQRSPRLSSKTLITCRLTGEELVDVTLEGIPDDEQIMNMIKPIIRDRLLNSMI